MCESDLVRAFRYPFVARLWYYVNYRKEVWAHMRDIDQDYADYAHTR